ncbi:MarR family winged helix-turn-helix transcriptional regulator [Alkalibacterium sp. f15]|uniref:MarR family winged helix-turn-helix transcriptional regulator n=1 Tax=Alkalibacterium sp. f15 TaxID=3414029 RepID=UPI003BF777F9
MNNMLIDSADIISLFCRLQLTTKPDIPIRYSEMGVLIFIQKQNSAVTPLNISQFFKITKPSVTSMVNALVKKEYVSKEKSEDDKRSYVLKITGKGNKLVESTFNDYYKSIELLRDNMGKDKFHQFIESMQLANDILEKGK